MADRLVCCATKRSEAGKAGTRLRIVRVWSLGEEVDCVGGEACVAADGEDASARSFVAAGAACDGDVKCVRALAWTIDRRADERAMCERVDACADRDPVEATSRRDATDVELTDGLLLECAEGSGRDPFVSGRKAAGVVADRHMDGRGFVFE